MNTMNAVVFHGVNDIRVEEVARPRPKAGEAVIRITDKVVRAAPCPVLTVRVPDSAESKTSRAA